MSLYNIMCGINPKTLELLALLGIDPSDVPRLRDCYLKEVDGKVRLVVYTRTGGGNRPDYVEGNQRLRALPGFVQDYDDDFDMTFAHFEFDLPPQVKASLLEDAGSRVTPREKLNAALAALKQQP